MLRKKTKLFFPFFERESERAHDRAFKGLGSGRERILSRPCSHWGLNLTTLGSWPKPKSSWSLNQLSHPDAPKSTLFFKTIGSYLKGLIIKKNFMVILMININLKLNYMAIWYMASALLQKIIYLCITSLLSTVHTSSIFFSGKFPYIDILILAIYIILLSFFSQWKSSPS